MTSTPGPKFQLGLQLGLCVLLTSLPTFVRQLNYPHACFTPVLTIICLVSMSADGHVGTKVQAAFSLLGETWVGAGVAGVMVSFAKPLQPSNPSAYLAVLCIMSSLGLACLIAPRAGPRPLTLWPHITVSALIFSTVVLYGQPTLPLGQFWRDDVGGVCAAGATAAGTVLVVSVLVLPGLAADQAVFVASAAIRGSGHAITRLLSLLLDPSPAVQHELSASSGHQPAGHDRQALGSRPQQWNSASLVTANTCQEPAQTEQREHKSEPTQLQDQPQILAHVEPCYLPQQSCVDAAAGPQFALRSGKHDTPRKAVRWKHELFESMPPAIDTATALIDGADCSTHQLQGSAPNSPSGGADLVIMDSPYTGSQSDYSFNTASTLSDGFTSNSSFSRTASSLSDSSTASAGSGHHAGNTNTEYFEQDLEQPTASLAPMFPQQYAGSHLQLQWSDIFKRSMSPNVDRSKLSPFSAHTASAHVGGSRAWNDNIVSVQQDEDGSMCQQHSQVLEHRRHTHHRHMSQHKWLQGHQQRPHKHRTRQSPARQMLTVLSMLHRRQLGHNLHKHHKEMSVHAAVLHTPSGPVAVLGPSVDELRPMLATARTCLQRAVLEPGWIGFPVSNQRAGLDIERWSKVLTAADRLLSMVSCLEDVLITAARRLIHPTLHPSTERFSDTATSAVCRIISCCSDVAATLSVPHNLHTASGTSSSTDWQAVRAELSRSSAAAMQEYWEFVYSRRHSQLKVARSSEILAVMFVWVMVGGLLEAAQQLEQAAAAATAEAVGPHSSRLPGVDKHKNCVHSKQQTQQMCSRRVHAAMESLLLLPVLSNCSAQVYRLLAVTTAGILGLSRSALTLLQQGVPELPVSTSKTVAPEKHCSSSSPWFKRFWTDRAVIAAFKLWLAMSILLSITLLVADPAHGHLILPTISEAVRASPSAGVIAFVLAWHERVESTIIRVTLRILGTAAGAAVAHAVLVNPVIATSPALLILLMVGVGMVLAPLADPSYHLRLTTALIMISTCVTIVCQYDINTGRARATVAFLLTRITEVVIACLWTALFNHLILPWSSARWSIETMAKSYSAVVTVIEQLCQVQFSRYAKPHSETSGASAAGSQHQAHSTWRSSGMLSSSTSILQSDVVAPLVAVQNELTLQVTIWKGWGPRRLVPRKVRKLMTAMLVLADRLTALQVVVSSLEHSDGDDEAADGQLATDTHRNKEDSAASRSLEFISDTIMRPVHKHHAQVLTLVRSTVSVLHQHVVQQGHQSERQLQQLQEEINQQWHNSRTVFAAQRHTLHRAVREHRAASLRAGELDVALDQSVLLPATAGGAVAEPSVHSSGGYMWWLHAAAHYQQQLAYQHAYDSIMKQLLHVLHLFSQC